MDPVAFCRILGDETRMKLYKLLLQRSYCVGALARKLGISSSAVSQHLKQMREAGLVTAEKWGYHVHYIVSRETGEAMAAELLALVRATPSLCAPAYGGCDEAEALHCRRKAPAKPGKSEE